MLKRILIGFPAFFFAFLVGLLFFEPARLLTSSTYAFLTGSNQTCATTSEGTPTLGYTNFPDLASANSSKYPMRLIDLFEHGTVFKIGETAPDVNREWLGLFENNGSSSIEPVKIHLDSPMYYSNNSLQVKVDGQTDFFDSPPNYSDHDIRVKIEDRIDFPVFIFSGNNFVQAGKVTTLYHRPSREEISVRRLPLKSMSIGYSEHFNLGQNAYELRVVPGTTIDGTKLNVLVLESEGKAQTLVYNRHYDRADRIGDLLWVGDLDGDGKLDLYFDDFDFGNGNFGSNLFLSCKADPGSLVKQVGFFESRNN